MKKSAVHKLFLAIAISLLMPCFVYSSETVIPVESFNIDNGLSQSNVTSLLLDSYGFLWVGTQDGLNRYDGYSFKAYRNNPLDDTSLSNNNILSICEDNEGNLWVGTWYGLSVFDRSTETFTNYYHSPDNPKTLSADRIFDLYRDKSGIIWVKTIESVDKYDSQSNSFVRYPHYSDHFTSYSDVNGFSMFEDSHNRFWVGTKDGLLLFDREEGEFKRYHHDPKDSRTISDNRVTSIVEDSDSNLWIATSHGINRYVPEKDTFIRYFHGKPAANQSRIFNVLFVDSKGRLFVGTEAGLSQFNTQTREFTNYLVDADGRLLYSSVVNAIIEDNSQILWVGTQAGLLKWDMKPPKFKNYSKNAQGENLFASNTIASVYDDEHTTWIGTWGNGLYLFNRKTNRVLANYSTGSPYPYTIPNNFVHVVQRLSNGELLIGTRNGVLQYDEQSKKFLDFFELHGVDASPIIAENRVYAISEDGNGNIWIATRLGLHRFNYDTIESFYHIPGDSLSLTSSEIHCLEVDGDDLWVGTFNGLNRINLNSYSIEKFQRDDQYSLGGLISNDIVSLKLDSKDFLWVGTSSGLHRYNKDDGHFKLYTGSNGLPNNLIYAIEEDHNGNIWVSTNWGVAMLNPDSEQVTSYAVSDGLQSFEFNLGASHKSATGEIFFGGISGLNSFHPDSIAPNQFTPPIAITSIEFVGASGQQEISIVGRNEIVIQQNYSLINIEFAALDFTQPQKNVFMYKLEGLEDDWINLGTKRSATFSNLPEGTYIFRVKGANCDNVWNNEGVSVRIVVKTEFWKSRLAYWLYGITFVSSLLLFLRARTKILRKTSRLLREREHTMSEVEKQKEALLIQNKSITDSINYAKRIQEALIPSEYHFRHILPESFILYMPKDIVSGDFYWINETENKIFVAAIDCTGHGVPGAFMSIIGVELLRNITNVMGINDAAEILNRLDKGVHDTFSKGGDANTSVKDGMDVSFCVIDKEQNILQFAGAFSNLYLIRDSKIIEVKGDRFSVGTGGDLDKPLFNSHLIPIQPEDMIYMFTDGYVDQFGGPEGKKYKFRRFRHLLLNIHKYPLDIQRKYLLGSINEWKGSLEQVDDILIIGIKPDLSVMF
jgi:ligand-binding sensor domain-containing protein/serine phosphatase RsbU (regulator of sigma subunit)